MPTSNVTRVRSEGGLARRGFFLLPHAGPDVGVNRLRARDGFFWRAQDFDFAARLARDAPGFGDHGRIRLESCGRSDAKMSAQAGADGQQRVADIVAIADVGELQPAQAAEALFEREEIGECLAGMEPVGKRVDHRDSAVRGELVE